MSKITKSIGAWLVFAAALVGLATIDAAMAQTTRRGGNAADYRVRDLVRQIRNQSDNFRYAFDTAIQTVRLRGADADNINRSIDDYERAVNDFEDRFNNRQAAAADVEVVLRAASDINRFLRTTRLGTRVDREWSSLRLSLNSLAREYNIGNWNWDGSTSNYPPRDYPNDNRNYPNNSGGNSNYGSRLTGTFRIDYTRSENPREVADRAVSELPASDRESARTTLEQRLETPDRLAIEQRGQQVTIASTRAPQYTFTADGRDKFETTPGGSQLRVRATLAYDRLEVSTSGDRGNDYNVAFEVIENGRTLRVERRLSTDMLRRTVVLQSFYARDANTAQLDLYENPNVDPRDNRFPNDNRNGTGRGGRNGDFVVAGNTELRATLNDALSTKTAKDGDRFSVTVQTPDQYRGAIIEGYVSGVQRTGKVTGKTQMTFNFETIRLRDGRTYDFAGIVESVRNSSGETVKVNDEGNVQGENQTKTTATRGAAGAAIGAIIGAIAGGGKGAAIGAIIGGGAGAGSVYVEGREDLELGAGSDVYIRSTAPDRRR